MYVVVSPFDTILDLFDICKNSTSIFTDSIFLPNTTYLGDLKNSALGHFWEIFLGGDGMGLLTSAENLEKFGKIWKIAKIQGGDRV